MKKEEILEYGLNVFNQEEDKFNRWLNSKIPALNNKKPIDLLQTEEGIQTVYTILARIDYGLILGVL